MQNDTSDAIPVEVDADETVREAPVTMAELVYGADDDAGEEA